MFLKQEVKMTSLKDIVTILTCHQKDKIATKTFSKGESGSIHKKSYDAGALFTHETKQASNLEDLSGILDGLSDKPNKFIIKGAVKEDAPEVVRRKFHGNDASFDAVARPYVMLDIDKQICPDYFDPTANPEEVVIWVQSMLPEAFRDVSCYYQFSASQGVYRPKEGGNSISMHLWYWCDRAVLDEEWKRYFKSVCSPVDASLFNAVQIHFTASPIFVNMQDPLPKRGGVYKGTLDAVAVPNIPPPAEKRGVARTKAEPFVSEEDKEKCLNLFLPYYVEGSRNRLCGAIAATLYRGGWIFEDAADFVYQLALKARDEEADSRYSNALRICDAIDQNLPAQGIPTMKNELKIKDLDDILDALGVGEPDINTFISKLHSHSELSDIKDVLMSMLYFSRAEKMIYLDQIAKQTFFKKAALKRLLEEIELDQRTKEPRDMADILMEVLLSSDYQEGHWLLYAADKTYWEYTGSFWKRIPEQHIKHTLMPHARQLIADREEGAVASLNSAVMNILEGRVYRPSDPLRQIDHTPSPVMNCLNGELWFSDDGSVTLKPHRPESYLRHCLDVVYDPSASSPMFDKAVLEIFSNSSDPHEMFRHFMELAGYICQPWRGLAIIVLLHGGGSNGKTSLVKIIRKMLGANTVMSDRIGDIEDKAFKIGDLDGKLLLLDDDVDGGTCLPDGFLKKISEEKPMTGQHKHKDPFEFICRAVPMMLSNDYPVTKDLTHGWRRRLQVIPFRRTFNHAEIKVGLFDDIWRQEASGILNHVVEGFARLKKRQGFHEPLDCLQAKNEWIVRSNALTTFINEMCETGDGYRVHLGDFYNAYMEYCREAGIKNIATRRGVEGRLEAMGFRIGDLGGKKAVWGLRLLSLVSESKVEPRM